MAPITEPLGGPQGPHLPGGCDSIIGRGHAAFSRDPFPGADNFTKGRGHACPLLMPPNGTRDPIPHMPPPYTLELPRDPISWGR